jgi:hypothetical protein
MNNDCLLGNAMECEFYMYLFSIFIFSISYILNFCGFLAF